MKIGLPIDGIHLLVKHPPQLSIRVLVNNLNSTSSQRMRFLIPTLHASEKVPHFSWGRISPVV
ncbi:transposase [Denitrificimonas halotolerans]|uniref:transposase n=1 Tax=Denitrificimonas halotolerans TaxID=3098930 RepID=UPI0038994769